jgi:transmembrane sensor
MSQAYLSSSSPDVKEVKACAADWLERRVCENWGEADQAELEAWLSQSPAHRVAYLRLESVWSRTYRLAPMRGVPQESERRRILPRLARIAAGGLAIALVGVGAALFLSAPKEQIYATGVGGHRVVMLADGSRIELNTDTVLRARIGDRWRAISLDRGEAFFQVHHDATRPFTVMAGNRRVTDLGTQFLIRRDTARLEVAVMEGRVRFENGDDARARAALLTPGDVAVSDTNSVSITRKPVQKLANEIGWRRGVLVFEHATLASAAAEFNRYNRQKLVVLDPAVARMTIDGTFQTDKVNAFTDLAKEVLGLRVENRGDQAVISR